MNHTKLSQEAQDPSNSLAASLSRHNGNIKKENNITSSISIQSSDDEIATTTKSKVLRMSAKRKCQDIPNKVRMALIDAVENKGEKLQQVNFNTKLLFNSFDFRQQKDCQLTMHLPKRS